MTTVSPSAMLAESLSEFSKSAYKAFSEVESQSRMEVARAMAEAREARVDRDKAYKDLHTAQMESQSWKQEVITTKAALTQAELTIANQAETLAAQVESIAQLRRELIQWKDQTKNWQEHFLRVEQERCAQSSRIDELIVEKLQYRPNAATLFTPKGSKHANGAESAPSSSSKRLLPPDLSPTQPPAYKSAAPPSPPEGQNTPNSAAAGSSHKRTNKASVKPQKRRHQNQDQGMYVDADLQEGTSKDAARSRKSNGNAVVNGHDGHMGAPSTVKSTVIRRVQAVVNVKREESYDDELSDAIAEQAATSTSSASKKKSESSDQQRYLRTPRPRIIQDEDDEEEEEAAKSLSLYSSADAEEGREDRGPKTRYTEERGRFRQRSRINYQESDDEEEDEEEDELMMGAEDNHDEIFGTIRVEQGTPGSRKNNGAHSSQPAKKRKLSTR
ncbi:hypothetical protein CPC08DRAFT_702388 [Agrocybe pediades]|nr:hypothetical protein CPC08DRAFT_702388 [Agrocybe pediades]